MTFDEKQPDSNLAVLQKSTVVHKKLALEEQIAGSGDEDTFSLAQQSEEEPLDTPWDEAKLPEAIELPEPEDASLDEDQQLIVCTHRHILKPRASLSSNLKSGKRLEPPHVSRHRLRLIQVLVPCLGLLIAGSGLWMVALAAPFVAGNFSLASSALYQSGSRSVGLNPGAAQRRAVSTRTGQRGLHPGTDLGRNRAATVVVGQDLPSPTAQSTQGAQVGASPTPQGSPVVDATASTLERFAYGQCTYWANMRYHQLTGHWVSWLGNAYEWSDGAKASGWIVSTKPHVPSIIVLQPGVYGSYSTGHVAVVESLNRDGSVHTSNYNWGSGSGYPNLSYQDFKPGPGVSFIWHP